MLFVTNEFFVFFLLVYLLFWALPDKGRFYLLIAASLFFYASWSPLFTLHLFAVIAINYVVMEIWRDRKWKWLFFGLQTLNVLNIAVYKYYYLFADSLGFLFGIDAWREGELRFAMRQAGNEIFLPLAISFYTFQIMSYGIDIYRGSYKERHSFREVLLFVSFFPQLIAGPIMRADDLLPQIHRLYSGEGPRPDAKHMKRGLWLVLAGVFKKVVIADWLLRWASPVFFSGLPASDFHPAAIWQAILGLSFMLYADFSAYTDLARGFGHLLGFSIPINFKAPFFMKSFSDFWRRWHLTFSYWIRDYIYIPLGGSRKGKTRNYFNLIFTFFIAGLWHGASYNFVLWGILMGLILSLESYTFAYFPEWPKRLPLRILRLFFTWILFLPVAILFFSRDMGWTFHAVLQMFSLPAWSNFELQMLPGVETLFGTGLAVFFFHVYEQWPQSFMRFRRHENWLLPLITFGVVLVLIEFAGRAQDFFYFQF